MTYDPDRDVGPPAGVNPDTRPDKRERTDMSVLVMLSIIAAFVAVGFWFYAASNDATVVTDRPVTEQKTTGTGAPQQRTTQQQPTTQEPPLPRTPTPPTVPSPPQQ